MLIVMTETRTAAPDGIHIVTLEEGSTVDVPEELAARYLARGQATLPNTGGAVPVPEAPVAPRRTGKVRKHAPENKA